MRCFFNKLSKKKTKQKKQVSSLNMDIKAGDLFLNYYLQEMNVLEKFWKSQNYCSVVI